MAKLHKKRQLGSIKRSSQTITVANIVSVMMMIFIGISTIVSNRNIKQYLNLQLIQSSQRYQSSPQQLKYFHPLEYKNINITEADLLMPACFRHPRHIKYRNIFGSWDHKTSNRSDHNSLNLATRTMFDVSTVSEDITENISTHTLTEWGLQSKNDLPPLILVPRFSNPAHCIQDALFSLLPLAYRGDLRGTRAMTWGDIESDYCLKVMKALEWFDEMHVIPDNTCFDKIWVPAYMHYRFPSGRSRGMYKKNDNGYLHKEDLPIEMLQFFQIEMWKAFLADNASLTDQGGSGMILFVSRRESSRRIWKNVDEIAAIVQQKMGGVKVHVIDDAGALTLQEQAELYHKASVLVTPHGGSNPNIVFMWPNTTVFEIHCTGDSWAREWVIDLGINHFPILPDAPPCKDHNEKFLAVQPETLVGHIIQAYANATHTSIDNDDGEYTAERCASLPAAAIDTILWAGEGDQVHDMVGLFFIAKRLGLKVIEQDFRKSYSEESHTHIWKALPLAHVLNYSHPYVLGQLRQLDCESCPISLWESDIRNTCMCKSRYMKGGVRSIFQSCNKMHVQYTGGGFNLTHYQTSLQRNTSLFLRSFDPCGLQRGSVFCPWLKEDLRQFGRGFFIGSYHGLRPFDGSNATCVHLRINDKYMKKVTDGLDISAMKATEVLDADNFGCCSHTEKEKKCSWNGTISDLLFSDYVKNIISKTMETSAPDLYIMAPPGVASLVRPLASDYGAQVYFLEDFIDDEFHGSPEHSDRIQCASSSVFASTKSSFSNTVKMMRGFQRWVWLHQFYNMSAVSTGVDAEIYWVEDWELPEQYQTS